MKKVSVSISGSVPIVASLLIMANVQDAGAEPLGNPRIAEARAEEARIAGADDFARSVAPVIRDIQTAGVTSLRGIARELVARNVPTRRGGIWTPVQVSELLKRLDRVAAGA